MTRLAGKRALVTGAASGIGAAIARAFVEQGASVLLTDRDMPALASTTAALAADHPDATIAAQPLDVTSEPEWIAALAGARDRLGGLSVLVHNAGVAPGGTLEQTPTALWRRAFAVNVEGAVIGSRLALPLLRAAPPAAIVAVASIAAVVAGPGLGAYAASKAALVSLIRTLAIEAAAAGDAIRANAILPGFVATPMLDGMVPPGGSRAALETALAAQMPLGRVATAREVAMAAVYLASEESAMMTGAELRLDGGYAAR